MRLSSKQANLLAIEVFKKLTRAATPNEVSDSLKHKLTQFYDHRDELKAAIKEAENDLEKHDRTFADISSKISRQNIREGVKGCIAIMEKPKVPTVKEIEDKIILKGMFANDQDMEAFVNSIIKEYTKKKTVLFN